ncbi:hypothetical protein NQ318_021864, partial [Aromia moschata]
KTTVCEKCKCRRASIKQSLGSPTRPLGRYPPKYHQVPPRYLLEYQTIISPNLAAGEYYTNKVCYQPISRKRLEFCRSMLQKHRDDPLFFKRILFTNESCFTNCGIFNLRNHHEWADANPRATVTRHSQFRFKINYWVGILGNKVLGAVELPSNLNSVNYLD